MASNAGSIVGVLADLVLPSSCAGCGATPASAGICARCAEALRDLVPYETVPTPCPPGLPPCVTLGAYDGPLREMVLAYKDDGRHRLARPLAVPLAKGIESAAQRLGHRPGSAIVVVPVPSTPPAARARNGDHMRRLARHATRALNQGAWPVSLGRPANARPKPDSAHLSAAARAVAANDAFAVREQAARRLAAAARAGARVIAVDDVLTTGATLASLATRLASHGVPVSAAVTIAATVRRVQPPAPRISG
jgi:predicted amidophosphoribosyltransferase